MKELLDIEQIARLFDVSVATVNYYTNLGLIKVDQKKGNKRFYDRKDVSRRMEKIRDKLNMGYTLKLIQREFILSEDIG